MVLGASKGLGAGGVGGDGLLASSIVVDSIVIGCVFCESSQKKGLGGIGVVEVRIKLFG
jgi:hypothetical protein